MKKKPVSYQEMSIELKRKIKFILVPAERKKQQAIKRFVEQNNNPFLVSFPRTGSHWLRMILELYFQRPQLTLTYFYPERDDYLIYHTHDMNFDVHRCNVIYLYREPVATVYSQMQYEKEPLDDPERVRYWTEYYARHLTKWLIDEDFTSNKTIIKYERLRKDMHPEFSKVTTHFGLGFDSQHLDHCLEKVSKERLKQETHHDERVVVLSQGYEAERTEFRRLHSAYIWQVLLGNSPSLGNWFTSDEITLN